ncbi:hypothetical protein JCM16303_004768 [Sporobolomyces ruberrimus]
MTPVTQLTSPPSRNRSTHPLLDTASTPIRTPKDLPRHPHSYSNHEFQSSPFLPDGEPIYDSPSPSSSISSFTTATLSPTSPPHPRRMPTSSSSSGEQGSRTLPSSSQQEGIIPSSSTSFSTKPISTPPRARADLDQNLESRYEGQEGKKAFGPKAGREFLARRQLQQQARDSFETRHGEEEEKDESAFSIRERIPIRPTGSVPRLPATTNSKVGGVGRTSGKPLTDTSGSPTSSRRKPVPPLSIDSSSSENRHDQTRDEPFEFEQSDRFLRDLRSVEPETTPTPREPNRAFLPPPPPPAAAKREHQQDFQLHRDPILNVSSPLPPRPAHGTHKPPPISGLNSHSTQDPTFPSGQSHPLRNRKGSSGSTGSVSKDSVLRELGQAIGRERRRRERFEGEVEKAKVEMKEIEGNLIVMREKFSTLTEQHKLTIRNLEQEIEEVEQELATADDLDETAAQEYLSLLSQQSLSHLACSAPSAPIDAFDPSLLRASTGPTRNPHGASLTRSPSILAALRLKKGFSSNKLKRRTVDPRAAAPDPPFGNKSHPTENRGRVHGFTRENLSTSRTTRQTETPPKKPDRNRSTGPVPRSPISSPPPRRPIFRSDDTSSDSHPNNPTTSPRPEPPHRFHPPISGATRKILTAQTESGIESDIVPSRSREREKGKSSTEGFKGRLRKRSNSFKEGFNGTMRVLFPSNAPKGSNANGTSLDHCVNHWLRAA